MPDSLAMVKTGKITVPGMLLLVEKRTSKKAVSGRPAAAVVGVVVTMVTLVIAAWMAESLQVAAGVEPPRHLPLS